MSTLEEDKISLTRGNRFCRVAFSTAILERVILIYQDYWVGHDVPEVAGAIKNGWAYACGESVDLAKMALEVGTVEAMNDFYLDESMMLAGVTTVAMRVSEGITATTEAESVLGADTTLHQSQRLISGDSSG